MKNKMQLQQGDVLLKRLDITNLPKGEKIKRTNRGFVLADGEVTGHAHVIDCEETDLELIRIGERMLARVNKTVTIRHEEHRALTLEPGIWEIGRVVEEDELGDMRNVQD